MSKKILVIGSGIAGISASRKLKSYGLETIVVDKGDFIGGRIATHIKEKENNKFTFFHGAQFFTARSKNFNQLLKSGINKNYIKKYENFSPQRYRGFPTMRNFLSSISNEIYVKQKTKVIGIFKNNKKINVLYEHSSKEDTYDAVISTLPAPQNIELMIKFPYLSKVLSSASYDSCIALMLAFKSLPDTIPSYFDLSKNKSDILSWLASSNDKNCWTIHANAIFSNENFIKDRLFIKDKILNELPKIFKISDHLISSQIVYSKLHFWKYAKVNNIAKGIQIDPNYPIAIAGDFMEGSRVESAFISGEKAAELIFHRLN